MSKYGQLINKIYPLLDPDLKEKDRREHHAVWFKETSTSAIFMNINNWEESETFKEGTVEELGLKAPCTFLFVPNKKILVKLIRRACQISDVVSEINPKELKTDPRS